ncbi:hypothetical protein EUGRSUZ_K02487 [Eucalyptus grandis]|uniref:Uncharacterized protein n=4 Tax=Eucalyptus grandis TaxID=71139 RepID=A0A059A684_EUCGR|nr:hypothetical protein EUGRSUZ_K02487 [Eucalyptus grandis]
MADAIRSFTIANPTRVHGHIPKRRLDMNPSSRLLEMRRSKRASLCKVNAFPDWTLMAVLVEQVEGQREFITNKSIWHLSDKALKSVYTFYIMFTCWGCLFFGSTKDPYYDSEEYRKDGGDGTGHWVYEKQEDIEESARAELWREELIEEIEQKVGGLRELEEAGRK